MILRTVRFALYSGVRDRLLHPKEAVSGRYPIGALHSLLERIPGVVKVDYVANVGEDVPEDKRYVGFEVTGKVRDSEIEQVVNRAGLNLVYKE